MTDFAALWKATAKKLALDVREVDLIDDALRQAIPTIARQRDEAMKERDALRAAIQDALGYIDGNWLAPFRPGETGHEIRIILSRAVDTNGSEETR